MSKQRIPSPVPGEKFGKWTVIGETDGLKTLPGGQKTRAVWVRCECGAESLISLYSLIYGKSRSCRSCITRFRGLSIETPQPGDKLGLWTVIEEVDRKTFPSGQKHRMVKVRCECGNVRVISLYDLRSGLSTQCHECAHFQHLWGGYVFRPKRSPSIDRTARARPARRARQRTR